ncbi:hypothetical protein SAMN04487948_101525 [Halogranum amylolyticum]|uniref:Uncharacterized protein n=1 Tax=Halogranum amylolyticum TaxID=660520 RepID=A0A1H8NGB2_9EURY|nr:hypothetical protein [Halogranum amylolyticum]SEO28529.1 hypothetical protein SAMN04487948_101525 [Halogranum amylolyticum]
MSSGTSVFPLTLAERVVLVVFFVVVVGGIALLVSIPGTMAVFSFVVSLFVLWLLWRLVRAAERIADATEDLATASTVTDD